MVDGLIRLMQTKYEITGSINLENLDEYTILQLAKIIIEITQSKSQIIFSPLPKDDPKRRKLDITKIKNILK